MSSIFNSFAASSLAKPLATFLGEDVTFNPKGQGPTPGKAIIFRSQLGTEAEDGNKRLDYPVEAQIEIASYPASQLVIGADKITCLVRIGDGAKTTKTISSIISQVGGMWHVRLD